VAPARGSGFEPLLSALVPLVVPDCGFQRKK